MISMTTEKTEEISSVENMTKQEMAKIIKTVKKESESSGEKNILSVCDVMKNNTSEIIQKMESKFSTYAQLYTDLYTKYLHSTDDLYGTCYISQKEFFDKLGMDNKAVQVFDAYWKSITKMTAQQIDMMANTLKMYVQFRIDTIDSYDKMIHTMMDYYARVGSQLNSFYKK
jgi:hypothetical protein